MDGFRLTKVLIDGGSGLNLIYEETLQKMEIDWNRIERSSTTFRGIIPSREARCTGKITLDVVFGMPDNYRSEEGHVPCGSVQQRLSRSARAGSVYNLPSNTPLRVHEDQDARA